MKLMLGCVFVLIFGGILFIFGIIRMIGQMLFGKTPSSQPFGNFNRTHTQGEAQQKRTYQDTHTGNAHHEGHPNSRQKRSGKIFEKNEGQYVDFEEIK